MEPENTPPSSGLSTYIGRLRAFFADRRVSLSGLLLFFYAAGIVTAFYIRDSHPVAIVHPGPYALVAIYQGKVYELVPMEDSVRHRHTGTNQPKSEVEEIGQVEPQGPVKEIPPLNRPSSPHKQNP